MVKSTLDCLILKKEWEVIKKELLFKKILRQLVIIDKNSEINSKEIELLKLQIREIQPKSNNPLSN